MNDDLTRPEGLYKQIAQRLRQDIAEGRLRPGDRLPSEAALTERFDVSRQTVRQAIATLRDEGLIEVEQGRGTFVRRPPVRLPSTRYSRSARQAGYGPFEATCRALGIEGYGELVLVERRIADERVASGLGMDVGTEIIYRRRYMHAGDSIIQIQQGHFPFSLVEGTPLAGTEKIQEGTYAALDSIGHGPTRISEQVTARMPTYSEATIFRSRTGVPVLEIERSTYDAKGQVVEWLLVTAVADQNVFVYDNLPVD